MPTNAKGTFDVKLTPRPPADDVEAAVGRMTIDNNFTAISRRRARGR